MRQSRRTSYISSAERKAGNAHAGDAIPAGTTARNAGAVAVTINDETYRKKFTSTSVAVFGPQRLLFLHYMVKRNLFSIIHNKRQKNIKSSPPGDYTLEGVTCHFKILCSSKWRFIASKVVSLMTCPILHASSDAVSSSTPRAAKSRLTINISSPVTSSKNETPQLKAPNRQVCPFGTFCTISGYFSCAYHRFYFGKSENAPKIEPKISPIVKKDIFINNLM